MDFADRDYRANSAPFTVSGRLTSAKTGRSVLVKYGASARVSSAVNVSRATVGKATAGHGRLERARRAILPRLLAKVADRHRRPARPKVSTAA